MSELQSAAFDRAAEGYDQELRSQGDGFDAFRRIMRQSIHRFIPPGATVLDLGCGSGADTVHLLATGRHVVAVDPSEEMLKVVQGKAAKMGALKRLRVVQGSAGQISGRVTPPKGGFDGVISSFGPLNGEADLTLVNGALSDLLRPGGVALLMPMGAICPWEVLWFLLAGQPKRAIARLKPGVVPVAVVADASSPLRSTMPCYFPFNHTIRQAFHSDFDLVSQRGLGVAMPPPYLHKRLSLKGALSSVERLDAHLGRWAVLKGMGDHCLYVFRKRNRQTA